LGRWRLRHILGTRDRYKREQRKPKDSRCNAPRGETDGHIAIFSLLSQRSTHNHGIGRAKAVNFPQSANFSPKLRQISGAKRQMVISTSTGKVV
jgi:hypothetical protein